jgi:hypothetical protein
MKGVITPSIAQSSEERELEDKIPKHLPIKVKIKKEKEKEFKDLKNEKWLRDLELEVTNIGDKPIYFLDFLLVMPGIKASTGNEIAFPLRYGRVELGTIENKAEPDDVPIKPGETYIFKAYDSNVLGWDRYKRNNNKPQPKKIILHFRVLNFGDGTGFWTTSGIPIPEPPKEKSSMGRCEEEQNKSDPKAVEGRRRALGGWPKTFSIDTLPASFLPANFLSIELSNSFSFKADPQSQLCCSGTGCFRSKSYSEYSCYNCPPVTRLRSAFCSDQTATCAVSTENTTVCTVHEDGFDYDYICTEYLPSSCGGTVPTPTPYPTPTPTPTATPTPTPCPLVCSEPYPSVAAEPCTTAALPAHSPLPVVPVVISA